MTKEDKAWLNTASEGKKPESTETEHEISKIKPLGRQSNSDEAKEDEKRYGLVDEDHPFPSKGN